LLVGTEKRAQRGVSMNNTAKKNDKR